MTDKQIDQLLPICVQLGDNAKAILKIAEDTGLTDRESGLVLAEAVGKIAEVNVFIYNHILKIRPQ
jgi:hypothetical protein